MIVQDEFDNQASAQAEFEEYVDHLADAVSPEIEIDSVPDDLGELYRVWNGSQLLGTFYQNLEGKWIAQPCNSDKRHCCNTSDSARVFLHSEMLAQHFLPFQELACLFLPSQLYRSKGQALISTIVSDHSKT